MWRSVIVGVDYQLPVSFGTKKFGSWLAAVAYKRLVQQLADMLYN